MSLACAAGAQLEVLEELLGSPYPSVATVLLQLLRELVAAAPPPPPRMALDMAARWLQVRAPVYLASGGVMVQLRASM